MDTGQTPKITPFAREVLVVPAFLVVFFYLTSTCILHNIMTNLSNQVPVCIIIVHDKKVTPAGESNKGIDKER
jgi:hypothetical protein